MSRYAPWLVLGTSGMVTAVAVTILLYSGSHYSGDEDAPAGDRVSALAAMETHAPSPLPSTADLAPWGVGPMGAAPDGRRPAPISGSVDPVVAAPTRLAIPELDVVARVVPAGMGDSGEVWIPADVSLVGWYEDSVPPGSAQGSSVIVGHRDAVGGIDGALYHLVDLAVGDRVRVTSADGQDFEFRVVARELIDKSDFAKQADEYFTDDGPPRLTLITCGGWYDPDNGGYQANVIVTAVPVQ